jgi:hypothetical protein
VRKDISFRCLIEQSRVLSDRALFFKCYYTKKKKKKKGTGINHYALDLPRENYVQSQRAQCSLFESVAASRIVGEWMCRTLRARTELIMACSTACERRRVRMSTIDSILLRELLNSTLKDWVVKVYGRLLSTMGSAQRFRYTDGDTPTLALGSKHPRRSVVLPRPITGDREASEASPCQTVFKASATNAGCGGPDGRRLEPGEFIGTRGGIGVSDQMDRIESFNKSLKSRFFAVSLFLSLSLCFP